MRRRVATVLLLAGLAGAFFVSMGPKGGEVKPYPAPRLSADPSAWLNSVPLHLDDGRVHFVEVWSYG